MRISQLATVGTGVVGVSALSGFGARMGRDAYRNVGNIIPLAIAIVAGLGAFILPYLAVTRLISWHPPASSLRQIGTLLKWTLVLLLGFALLYPIACFVWLFLLMPPGETRLFTDRSVQIDIAQTMALLGILPVLVGAIVGLRRRKAQKAAYRAALFNQDFLNNRGFSEYIGSRFSYVDGNGNKLRIVGQNQNVIEFVTDRDEEAFITIDCTGRFSEYIGPA